LMLGKITPNVLFWEMILYQNNGLMNIEGR